MSDAHRTLKGEKQSADVISNAEWGPVQSFDPKAALLLVRAFDGMVAELYLRTAGEGQGCKNRHEACARSRDP